MAATADVLKQFDVALDISRSISNREFTVVEGDTGNILHITLTDNGEPVDLTNCRVLAVFSKSTGTSSQDSSQANGGVTIGGTPRNQVTIRLFTSSVAPGMVECELQVYSGEKQTTLVTSAKFNFTCRRAILNDDTVQATTEYPLLMSLMEQVKEALRKMEEAADAARAAADAAYEAAKAAGLTNHAAQHAKNGTDPITPGAIGALPSDGIIGIGNGGTGNTLGYVDKLGVEPNGIPASPFTVSNLREKLRDFAMERLISSGGYTAKFGISAFSYALNQSWVAYWNNGNLTQDISTTPVTLFTFMLCGLATNANNPLATYLVTSYNTAYPLMYIIVNQTTFSDVFIAPMPDLRFQNVSVATSAWTANTGVGSSVKAGYAYRGTVACTGVTAAMLPEVIFSAEDAVSGNFAPVSDAYAGGVYIYAKTKPTAAVTIPTIVVRR